MYRIRLQRNLGQVQSLAHNGHPSMWQPRSIVIKLAFERQSALTLCQQLSFFWKINGRAALTLHHQPSFFEKQMAEVLSLCASNSPFSRNKRQSQSHFAPSIIFPKMNSKAALTLCHQLSFFSKTNSRSALTLYHQSFFKKTNSKAALALCHQLSFFSKTNSRRALPLYHQSFFSKNERQSRPRLVPATWKPLPPDTSGSSPGWRWPAAACRGCRGWWPTAGRWAGPPRDAWSPSRPCPQTRTSCTHWAAACKAEEKKDKKSTECPATQNTLTFAVC